MHLVTRFGSRKFTGDTPWVSSLMMMLGFGLLLQRLASKKVLLLLLFAEIFGALGVVTLHFKALFCGEVWEVANEKDQLPTIFR